MIFNFLKKIISFFGNTSFLLTLSLIFAIIYPNFAFYFEPYLMPLLILLMLFSLLDVEFKKEFFLNLKNIRDIFIINFLTYFVFGFFIFLLSYFFISDIDFRNGFLLMAIVPCAISIIPYTRILKGNVLLSTISLYFNYFISLFLTPFLIWFFFKEQISLFPLLRTIFLLVFIPLILSRILEHIDKKYFKYFFISNDKIIINFLFFIMVYSFIGLNIKNISAFENIKEIVFLLFFKTLFLGLILFFIFNKFKKISEEEKISYILFANFKNIGYAIVLALTLFNKETALPSVLALFFDNFLFIIYSFFYK
ncbi:MAG: hypothetical protein QW757_02945 [Candidatus Woesearchaeota archaeon]